MRIIVQKVLLLLCLLPLRLFCQQAADDSTTFRSRTELVLVPMVAVDKSGKHIPNLTQKDFSLFQDKQERKIAFFEEIRPLTAPPRHSSSGYYSNVIANQQSTARLTVFALDLVNTPFIGQVEARRELLKILAENIDSREPKALLLFTRSGLRVLHDFTSDPKLLAAALRKFAGKDKDTIVDVPEQELEPLYQRLSDFARPENVKFDEFQSRVAGDTTVGCFKQIATAFAGIPGRKTVIWATAGFPMYFDQTHHYRKIWEELNTANVTVYAVDVREMVDPTSRQRMMPQARRPNFPVRGLIDIEEGAMTTFAEETGGKACLGRSDFSSCFKEAIEESSSHYVIGYYLDQQGAKPGWHKLDVKTQLKKVKVRARPGFSIPDPKVAVLPKTEMDLALVSPLDYTAIPVSARWTGTVTTTESTGKRAVEFQLMLPPGAFIIDEQDTNHMHLEVAAVARNARGDALGLRGKELESHFTPETVQHLKREGFLYKSNVEVSPGEYNVRFVVRDYLSGRIGSVSAPLKVD